MKWRRWWGYYKKDEFTERGISTLGQQDSLHKQIHNYENTFNKPLKVKKKKDVKKKKKKLKEREEAEVEEEQKEEPTKRFLGIRKKMKNDVVAHVGFSCFFPIEKARFFLVLFLFFFFWFDMALRLEGSWLGQVVWSGHGGRDLLFMNGLKLDFIFKKKTSLLHSFLRLFLKF